MSALFDRPLLHVYPGGGLMDLPFEEAGFCVVRGPDLLHGRNQRELKRCRPGTFSGIIGGPPCQPYSLATGGNESLHVDEIPVFWALVDHYQPDFAVMEEVVCYQTMNHPAIPSDVRCTQLRDFDCGGLTERIRGFWTRGFTIPNAPHRDGASEWSVLARSWDKVVSDGPKARAGLHSNLSARRACELQGFPDFMDRIADERRVIPDKLIVHMMGNGVPRAMGEWVVRSLLGIPHPVLPGQQMDVFSEANSGLMDSWATMGWNA